MKAKRKVHEFNFKSEGAHVALVDAAANLQEVLTMKASDPEVVVSLSMREFLQKFFSLWYEDASVLAGIMGYSTEMDSDPESYEDYIKSRIDSVQLLKGKELPEKLPESMTVKIESLIKQMGGKLTSEDLPLGANNLEGDSKLSDVKVTKEELELLKSAAEEASVLKAQLAEVESLKAQIKEVDTLKSLVESLQKEKAEKQKLEMASLVKGYAFIPEADQDGVVEFLIKSENPTVIITALEKARDAIAAAVSIEEGTQGSGSLESEVSLEKSHNTLVSDLLKKRYAK